VRGTLAVDELMRPGDLPLRETLRYLERTLPPAPMGVLEVGCGDGAVARALAEAGYEVTGLDETIETRDGGPRWVEADFLFYEGDEPYDVIVFTRSLHHMSPVSAALRRAHDLLVPGGFVIAEEFAHDRVNIQTARWLYDLEAVLEATGLLAGSGTGSAPAGGARAENRGDSEGNPLGRWRREHTVDPPLQTGHAILAAARDLFELTSVDEAPYVYRYLCDRLEPTERGAHVARRTWEIESRLIRERDVTAAGLRFVGRRAD
jgi:SAM-dependent methyltransferase